MMLCLGRIIQIDVQLPTKDYMAMNHSLSGLLKDSGYIEPIE